MEFKTEQDWQKLSHEFKEIKKHIEVQTSIIDEVEKLLGQFHQSKNDLTNDCQTLANLEQSSIKESFRIASNNLNADDEPIQAILQNQNADNHSAHIQSCLSEERKSFYHEIIKFYLEKETEKKLNNKIKEIKDNDLIQELKSLLDELKNEKPKYDKLFNLVSQQSNSNLFT